VNGANGGARGERGDRAWSWVVRFAGLGVFVYGTSIRDTQPSWWVGFLGVAVMVMPIGELRTMLREWRRGSGGPNDA
jgi:hypothetical protein